MDIQSLRIELRNHPELAGRLGVVRTSTDLHVESARGREVRLQLPNQQAVSVNLERLKRLCGPQREGTLTLSLQPVQSSLENAYNEIRNLVAQGSRGMIPVHPAGRGPTAKSRKIRVEGVVHDVPFEDSYDTEAVRAHTLTLPVSLLAEDKDKILAPRWLLMRTVRERVLNGNAWPLAIRGGEWPGAGEFWNEVFAPMLALLPGMEAELQSERERRSAELAQLEAETAARGRTHAAWKTAQEAIVAKQRADRENHMASLESLQVECVEWDEWVQFKNKYGSKTRKKETYTAENCTLRFSGQRVYIILPDGEEIIKARHNVRWSSTSHSTN